MNDLKELVVGLYNRDEWTKEQVIARVVNEGISAQVATQYVEEIYKRLSLGSPLDDLPEVVSEPPPDAQGPMETPPQPPQVGDPPPSPPEPEPSVIVPKETERKKRKRGRRLLVLLTVAVTGVSVCVLLGVIVSSIPSEDKSKGLPSSITGEGKQENELDALRKAAEQGDAVAQYNLGVCYANGNGVNQDMTEAVKWWRLAAEQGDAVAQYNLGVCYANGNGVNQDMTEAVKWWRKAAEQGNADAQYNLGGCYYNGAGTLTAEGTLNLSGEAGALSMNDATVTGDSLSAAGVNGSGTLSGDVTVTGTGSFGGTVSNADVSGSLSLDSGTVTGLSDTGELATTGAVSASGAIGSLDVQSGTLTVADSLNAAAQSALREIANNPPRKDEPKKQPPQSYQNMEGGKQENELDSLREAAEQGEREAQKKLGDRYYSGDGVSQDMTEVVKWYRLAAEQGSALAQCNLGNCYYNGEGVDKDMAQAVKWYRAAAEQGNAQAQCNLGNCYYYGKGVGKDMAQAMKWYRAAAEQGNILAQNNLGNCYYYGRGVSKDMTQAVKWYRAAADRGEPLAQCNLGNCYFLGSGVGKDLKKAMKWYRLAAEQGNKIAQENLDKCRVSNSGVSVDDAELLEAESKDDVRKNFGSKDSPNALDEIRISGVNFDRTPIADVIDFLRGELKKVNKGGNIIYVPSQGTSGGRTAAEPEVTASFSDLSLREALDGVCKSAGCTYKEKGRTIYIYQSK